MAMNEAYYRPALKSSVDIQLQTAFSDGNWPTVVRLADKRAKALNDPYYEVVKTCAESRLEGPLERCAALILMDSLVRAGTAPKEAEALELLEWACRDIRGSFNYSETLGTLRARWVKANPRSPAAPLSLRACIQNWDLVNAQQIAAILDKSSSSPSQRHYMYWSILLTYMLSCLQTSDEHCPKEKQKIYSMLAMRQLERAAETTETTPAANADGVDGKSLDRGLRTDEEVVFYYRLLASHGPPDDFLKRMRSPTLGALKQFDQGRKHLLLEALRVFESRGQWEAVFEFCLHALQRKENDGSPSFLAADWVVWRLFIAAAARVPNQDEAFGKVQDLLSTFADAVKSRKVSPMYTKNIGLALVQLAFQLPEHGLEPQFDGPASATPRVVQLALFLEQHGREISAMDDVKAYVEQLSFPEARYLVDDVLMKRIFSKKPSSELSALYVKLRYFLTSCPQTLAHVPSVAASGQIQSIPRCKYCSVACAGTECHGCLAIIAGLALDLYVENEKKADQSQQESDRVPNVELALVVAMCLLKLAGFRPGFMRQPRLQKTITPLVLQAVAVLDTQLEKTPNQPPLRLLLAQLYLLLGCASRAYEVWRPLGVKRTIHDALSPLLFDRISTISPGLFAEPKPLMESLRMHYAYSLKDPSPVKIWDAFDSGSYSSVLEVTGYCDKLRRSCTLVMAVVEERRAARALGGRQDDLDDIPFLDGIFDDTELVTTIDHGSIPDFESSLTPRLAQSLGVGPPPSNTRSHLSLLGEEFLQLCAFAPSKDFKPTKPNDAADHDFVYVSERLIAVHESLTRFIHLEDTTLLLTSAEESYYNALTLLSGAMMISLVTVRGEEMPVSFGASTTALKTAMATLRNALLPREASPADTAPVKHVTLGQLSDPHTMAMLRETALAVRLGAALVLGYHDSQMARDRTGKTSLHKDAVAEMKVLVKLAFQILDDIKERIKLIKSELAEPTWKDRVIQWTYGEGEDGAGQEPSKSVFETIGGRTAVEAWAGKVVESWREGIKGWGMVKME
ncbi:hypothetical protein RB598_009901 [Gaeumannomyces tritici]